MKNKMKKNFDAVKMMREIKEKLSKRYWKNPDLLKKEMEAIRKKYVAESVK
jgi:hypothetical protein